jgi:hypothetical protein
VPVVWSCAVSYWEAHSPPSFINTLCAGVGHTPGAASRVDQLDIRSAMRDVRIPGHIGGGRCARPNRNYRRSQDADRYRVSKEHISSP